MNRAEILLFLLLIMFVIAVERGRIAYGVSRMWRSHRRKNAQTARADQITIQQGNPELRCAFRRPFEPALWRWFHATCSGAFHRPGSNVVLAQETSAGMQTTKALDGADVSQEGQQCLACHAESGSSALLVKAVGLCQQPSLSA